MSSRNIVIDKEFIHPTESPSIIDEIDIKYEEVYFDHNAIADLFHQDHEKVSNIAYVDCSSVKAEGKELNDFYLELVKCQSDCETCLKYMRILSRHVRDTHAPLHSIRDPLFIDPLDNDPDTPDTDTSPAEESSSSVQIKCDDDVIVTKVTMEYSEEDSESNSESDAQFELESASDPDYSPSTQVTPNVHREDPDINHASSASASLRRIPSSQEQGQFNCSECDRSFTRKINLELHTKSHTGEKPYKCDRCQKSFTRPSSLKRHNRIHSGEKPFKCNLCQRTFPQKYYLTYHEKTHTGERPYSCDMCEKSFTMSSNLATHKKQIHSVKKPFK